MRLTTLLAAFSTILIMLGTSVLFAFLRQGVDGFRALWDEPVNRVAFAINLASSLVFQTALVAAIALRKVGSRWALVLLLRGRTVAEERERVASERVYLENFRERMERDLPWEVDRFTDMDAVHEDVEVRAHTVRLWRLPSEAHDGSQWLERPSGTALDIRSFLSKARGPVMLKGNPGTGKTLTLRRHGYDEATRALRALPGEAALPVFVSLASYRKASSGELETVFDFLQRYLREEYPSSGYLREHLTTYLNEGRLSLLFDGLNEIPAEEYQEAFAALEEFVRRKFPRVRAIFTCRSFRHTSLDFETVTLNELSDQQVRRFIAAYRGREAADELFRDIASGEGFLLRACRNPFMLRMLVIRSRLRSAPLSRSHLFSEYVQDQLADSPRSERVASALRQLAYRMQEASYFAGDVNGEWVRSEINRPDLDLCLTEAAHANLIQVSDSGRISFYHQILQEYFAASELLKKWEVGEAIDHHFTDRRWEDSGWVSV